jgi:hypothetical protein
LRKGKKFHSHGHRMQLLQLKILNLNLKGKSHLAILFPHKIAS